MATPEQLRRQREFIALQNESIRLSRSYADEAKRLGKIVFDNNEARVENNRIQRETQRIIKEVSLDINDIQKGTKSLTDLYKTQNKYQKFANSFTTEYKVLLQTILKDNKKVEEVLKGQVEATDAIRAAGGENLSANLALNSVYEEQAANLQMQAEALEGIEKNARNIASGTGGLEVIGDTLSNVLQKQGLGNIDTALGLGEATTEARKMAAELTGGGNRAATMAEKFKISGKFVGAIGKNLTKALGPAAAIAFILNGLVSAFKTIDKRSGETAKNLGISYKEALRLDKAMTQVASSSGEVLLNSTDLLNAQNALNKEFGTSVRFSDQFVKDYALIAERLELSAEAQNKFAYFSCYIG